MNYTTKAPKTQHLLYTNYQKFIKKHNHNCTSKSRCNDFRVCPYCSKIHRVKREKKLLSHLSEDIINSYKYKYFITFTSSIIDYNYTVQEKNSDINIFTKEFIKAKRLKNFVINKNSQYIINKEISYSKDYGYNPHNHMILLTNKKFDLDNPKLKELMSLSNIDIHLTHIREENNSYKKSIVKLFNYINKFNSDTKTIQEQTKILKGEHSNKHTDLFNKKSKLHKTRLSNNFKTILLNTKPKDFEKVSEKIYINILEAHRQKIKEAKAIFKRNSNKLHTKNYIRLLKSLRKKQKLLNLQLSRKLSWLKATRSKFL